MHARCRETPALARSEALYPVVKDVGGNRQLFGELDVPVAPPVGIEQPIEGDESPRSLETHPPLHPWALTPGVAMLDVDEFMHESAAALHLIESCVEPDP